MQLSKMLEHFTSNMHYERDARRIDRCGAVCGVSAAEARSPLANFVRWQRYIWLAYRRVKICS